VNPLTLGYFPHTNEESRFLWKGNKTSRVIWFSVRMLDWLRRLQQQSGQLSVKAIATALHGSISSETDLQPPLSLDTLAQCLNDVLSGYLPSLFVMQALYLVYISIMRPGSCVSGCT